MTTDGITSHTRRHRLRGPITLLIAAGLAALAGAAGTVRPLDGRDTSQKDSSRPSVTAAFRNQSYRPGQPARLFVDSRARNVTVQFFRAGSETGRTPANDIMLGRPVSKRRDVGSIRPGQALHVRMGPWASGVYFAELRAAGGRVGYAPFVLRPRRLGEHRVAIVMPTQTWQAYNYRDDDGDGDQDTWYAQGNTARLGRPYLNRGVPYHYKYYDAPFLKWLAQTDRAADYLSDADLGALESGRELASRYSLMIFPGHHEYVTEREYNVVLGYRNRGGNLMFLSANNFFWKVVRHGQVMERVSRWRDVGRPEAQLIGTQYFTNDDGQHRGPWVVRRPIPWLFAGTGLRKGSRFSSGGIEGDHVYPSSPGNVQVVAEIPDLFGRGMTAQMTYYERGRAKVFAAGAFTLAAGIWNPQVQRIVANLWARLSADVDFAV